MKLSRRWGRFFRQAAKLVFQLRHAAVEAFQGFARLGGDGRAILAMMARGGAAFDGIFKFLAAGATGALALAGGRGCGHSARFLTQSRHAAKPQSVRKIPLRLCGFALNSESRI
jgi:hypothetical protein